MAHNRYVVQCDLIPGNICVGLFDDDKKFEAGLVFRFCVFLFALSVQWFFPFYHWCDADAVCFQTDACKRHHYCQSFLQTAAHCISARLVSLTHVDAYTVAGALIQLAALGFFIQLISSLKIFFQLQLQPIVKWFWLTAGSAFAVKIVLQAFSAIPQLNTYAFGVRPIVIGFLHLVLLAFVSVFLMGYLLQQQFLQTAHSLAKKAAWLFLIAVLLNEALLMLHGVVAMNYESIPYMNYYLLGAAILLFTSLLLLFKMNTSSTNSSFPL
jgi:hypothetical protein